MSSAESVIAGELAKWSDAFAHNDWNALTQLYSLNALLYGSAPQLFHGEGIKSYFNALPPLSGAKASFSGVKVVPIGSTLINVAGIVSFSIPTRLESLAFRITLVYVIEEGAWKIISHHVSQKAA
ncbi:nuclear transport factor 2 family protein [Bradyrhizobium sp. AUGA SZCCT0240]|uniref:nuclear transport factor 2 family protein n=1 Tax=Bradyrhizobium sp. AUGA SZCCT0240 TaxID=2807669 RepID=UPI001BA4F8AD|nr:nuclear transport factor 2 family protein [Bradyrhizobium sp. AUGA SZCCT0240]MBR1252313.1 nuclear transport factor 2 family protein [Bradyrhizobium sp. AUGA SZCCT0240]